MNRAPRDRRFPDRRDRPPAHGSPRSPRPGPRRPGSDRFNRGPAREPGWLAHRIRIVHEDDDILVVDKPAGLLTANMPGERRDAAFDAVKEYVRGRRRRPVQVWIIHRLDKEVSGLLVFAKSERAFHWLKEDFRSRRTHRLYAAVVEGEVRPSEAEKGAVGEKLHPDVAPSAPGAGPLAGTIQSYLIEEESGEIRSVDLGGLASAGFDARGSGPRGRPSDRRPGPPRSGQGEPRLAVTHWRVVHAGHGRTLLQLRLETGRKNQIRVHMTQWGHPVCGDRRFGAQTDPIGRVALHAAELGFSHPGTGQTVRYSSPIPTGFHRLVGLPPPTAAPTLGVTPVPPPAIPETPPAPAAPSRPAMEDALPPAPPVPVTPASRTSWDHVAQWYDRLIDEQRSDLYHEVIVPGTFRLLAPRPGIRVLDVACGQGDLCRRLAELGVQAVGLDAAPRLIEAARARPAPAHTPAPEYLVGDAAAIADPRLGLAPAGFDAATCVMALMNINPLEPVLRGVAGLLRPGGSFVCVILHPAFRAPGQTAWGWERATDTQTSARRDDDRRPSRTRESGVRQFRRVDGYLSPGQSAIVMNPGAAAKGAPPVTTTTFHRPIQAYVQALTQAGLLIAALEEWPSPRVSQPGPRAAEENRARREIPMFLAIRAVRAQA